MVHVLNKLHYFLVNKGTFPHTITSELSVLGFSTEKGKLLRSILFPSGIKLEFFRDAIRFVGILSILGKELLLACDTIDECLLIYLCSCCWIHLQLCTVCEVSCE